MRISVPPALFEKQIKYLVSHDYHILPIAEIFDYLSGKKKFCGKKIVLTFDDGFSNNLTPAINTLHKNGLTATYFLTSDYIGKDEFPWCSVNGLYSKPMNLEEILKLLSLGMSVGSHARSHMNLGGISNDTDKLYREIAESKEILQAKLKVPVKYFAYPFGSYGSYNNTTEEMVKNSGYQAAFTNIFGLNIVGDNIFALKRTRIDWHDTMFRFKMKLRGAYDWTDAVLGLFKQNWKSTTYAKK